MPTKTLTRPIEVQVPDEEGAWQLPCDSDDIGADCD